jgi:hypothetical protein
MKTLLVCIATTLLIGAAYYGLKPTAPSPGTPSTGKVSLPWQIEVIDQRHSKVFGVTLGLSRLEDVIDILGIDHELAIISDNSDHSALELYVSHFKTGPLAAKLIVTFDVSEDLLMQMREESSHAEYMATGSRKFLLSDTHLQQAMSLSAKSITLIPSAQLDDDIVRGRFGEPANVVATEDGIQHYLYPKLGLAIALKDDAKDSLQYVAPVEFGLLSDPLQKK